MCGCLMVIGMKLNEVERDEVNWNEVSIILFRTIYIEMEGNGFCQREVVRSSILSRIDFLI